MPRTRDQILREQRRKKQQTETPPSKPSLTGRRPPTPGKYGFSRPPRTPVKPKAVRPPTRRPPPKRGRPRRHTVKAKDTYATLAEKYDVPQDTLIKTAGIKKLTAGQVIPLPEAPARVVPDLPGYGPTVEDMRARGAVVTGQQDIAGYEAFRAQEVATTNENAIINAYNNLSPYARGPQAQIIKDQYNALQAARRAAAGPEPARPGEIRTEEQRARQQEISQASYESPWDYFKWWMGGAGQEIDPKTGKITTTPYEGRTQADRLAEEGQLRRAEAMQAYYTERATAKAPRVDGVTGAQVPPQLPPEYGEPYAIENYPLTDSMKNYSDGENVYYNGRIIPQDEFLDFLEANRTQFKDLTEMMESEEGQRQLFVQGAKLTLSAVSQALQYDDRDMLPDVLTPAQLALMGSDRDWDDYMRNVLNYRWDAEKGAWIKQEEDDNYPVGTGGYGAGYGGGWGGYGSSGAAEWTPGSGQVQAGGTGKAVRADMRFAQNVGGIAEIHWRV